MAATATPILPMASDPVPTKNERSRKALKQKNPSSNEANILSRKSSDPLDLTVSVPESGSIEGKPCDSLSAPIRLEEIKG